MHVDLSSLEAKREKKQKLAALYPLPTRGYTSHRYVRERTRQDIQFSSQHSFLIFSRKSIPQDNSPFVVFPDPCDFAYSCEMTACLGDE
ncbi:hypothetical protein MRB53_017009 [Persea americana]|uniref:Uncharacterized protein n=1 Tax=Persea americana TaxID=3435 RepID=A0ACC2M3T7_PERAE|nr:hypothetical protein MRB53_017009 [Persea americana]